MSRNAARITEVTRTSSCKRRPIGLQGLLPALILTIAVIGAAPANASAQEYGFLGAPGHWCTFNRACNWTAHAGIAFGTTYVLDKVGVPLPVAAGAGAALFIGKEVRDHIKWGDFWTFDSLVDMGTGVAGAGLAYWLLKPDERSLAAPFVDAEGRMGLELRLPLQ